MNVRPRTVRTQTTALAVLVVAISLALAAVGLVVQQRRNLLHTLDASLQQRVTDLGVVVENGGVLGPMVTATLGDDIVVQIVDQTGGVITATANGDSNLLSSRQAEPQMSVFNEPPAGHDWQDDRVARIAALQVRSPVGHDVAIYAASSTEKLQESVSSLTRGLLVATPILLLFLAGLLWLVIGRALRPVEAIRQSAEGISAHDLSQRVPTTGTGDEIDRLGETMNQMLGRLQQASDQQRAFVGDASHELRTPLTGVVAQIEAARMVGTSEALEIASQATLLEARRMQTLIEDLLSLARTEATAAPIGRSPNRLVDFDEVVLDEVHRTSADHLHLDSSLVAPAQVRTDSEILRRIVRNLLDNAARHARQSVAISLVEQSGIARLTVGDDGAGIAPDDRERVFDRFVRLDAARSRDGGGAGLGLAIVRALLTNCGGSITVEESPLGGALFVVEVPAAA